MACSGVMGESMKCANYIAGFLKHHGIAHVFGYPGGMVTHLLDAFYETDGDISVHIALNEQGAGFAACGYAQRSGNCGVAFATSGPGAVNLLSAICNAYCDSLPLIVMTGQVNTYESKGDYGIRQRGFQETDIISMARPVTKEAFYVSDSSEVPRILSDAYAIAVGGRKGPVLIDIPMDMQRAQIPLETYTAWENDVISYWEKDDMNVELAHDAELLLRRSKRPVLVFGEGVRHSEAIGALKSFLESTHVPSVSSMLAIDIVPDYENYYGFLGAYGDRAANFIVAKADVVLFVGSRADIRQIGKVREQFAPEAGIIRVDIDAHELEYHVHGDEITICADARNFLEHAKKMLVGWQCPEGWTSTCRLIDSTLRSCVSNLAPNVFMGELSSGTPPDWTITTDVGQNQVWCAQSFSIRPGQRILFSGGFGAMGYSLPAAIGAYYASGKPVLCITGDGGLQMNIQELGFVASNRLPIHIVVLDNKALGMIRHFQEMYFEERYAGTTSATGYSSADFDAIASAYGITSGSISIANSIPTWFFSEPGPTLLHVSIDDPTYVLPKLEYGKPNQDQEPLLDRALYDYIMDL